MNKLIKQENLFFIKNNNQALQYYFFFIKNKKFLFPKNITINRTIFFCSFEAFAYTYYERVYCDLYL